MKPSKLILWISLLPITIIAQQEIKWSEIQSIYASETYQVNLNKDIFILHVNTSKSALTGYSNKLLLTLEKYNEDLELIKESTHKLKYDRSSWLRPQFVIIEQKLWLLTTKFENERELVLFSVDTDSLSLGLQAKTLISYGSKMTSRVDRFHFKQSPDSRLLMIISELTNDGDSPKQIQFTLFDQKFNLIYQKTIDAASTDKKFTYVDTEIDNQGNFFMFAFQENGYKRKKLSRALLFQYKLEKQLLFRDTISSIEGKYLKNIQFEINDDSIFVAGYYLEKNDDTKKAKGILSANFPKWSNQKIIINYTPITFYFIGSIFKTTSENQKDWKKRGLTGLEIKEVLYWNDSYFIFGEKKTNIRRIYNRIDGMIISCIDKSGNLLWEEFIKKEIYINELAQHSYKLIPSENELKLFINLNKEEYPNYGFYVFHINNKGILSKEMIFSKIENKYYATIPTINQIEENQYFILCRKFLNYKVGVLSLE